MNSTMKLILLLFTLLLSNSLFGQSLEKIKAALDKGDLVKAKQLVDKAINIDYKENKSDNIKAWYYRGMVYAELDLKNNESGAFETAMEAYNKAITLNSELSRYTGMADSVIINNVNSKLDEYYSNCIQKGTDNYNSNNYLLAATCFEHAFQIDPSDIQSIINAAYAATVTNDLERGIKNFELAIDAGVRDKDTYIAAYNTALRINDFKRAKNFMSAALKLYPKDLQFLTREYDALLELGNINEAKSRISDARKIHPYDIRLIETEVGLLIELKEFDNAKQVVESSLELNPDDSELHFALGVVSEKLNAESEAIASYKRSLALDSDHIGSMYNLGMLHFNKAQLMLQQNQNNKEIDNRYRLALNLFEKLTDINTNQDNNALNRDLCLLEKKSIIYKKLKMVEKEDSAKRILNLLGSPEHCLEYLK